MFHFRRFRQIASKIFCDTQVLVWISTLRLKFPQAEQIQIL